MTTKAKNMLSKLTRAVACIVLMASTAASIHRSRSHAIQRPRRQARRSRSRARHRRVARPEENHQDAIRQHRELDGKMTTHVRDMTPEQQAAALAALKREQPLVEPPPADPDQPKLAKNMTPAERAAFLQAHKLKFRL
jgi:hypothetical protein